MAPSSRFALPPERRQAKVDAQWKLFRIVHNVAKLERYGKLAAQAGKWLPNMPFTTRIPRRKSVRA